MFSPEKVKVTQLNNKTIGRNYFFNIFLIFFTIEVIRISKRRTLKRLPSGGGGGNHNRGASTATVGGSDTIDGNEKELENIEREEMFKLFGQYEIPKEWYDIFQKAGLNEDEMNNPKILKYIMKKVTKYLKSIETNNLSIESKDQSESKISNTSSFQKSIESIELKKLNENPSEKEIVENKPPWLIELEKRNK